MYLMFTFEVKMVGLEQSNVESERREDRADLRMTKVHRLGH